jgi:hypothetical protein
MPECHKLFHLLPDLEAEEEMHLREATRVAGSTTLLAAVFKENIFMNEEKEREVSKKNPAPLFHSTPVLSLKKRAKKSRIMLKTAKGCQQQ